MRNKTGILAVLGMFCMAVSLSSASWVMVDDFEGYQTGVITQVTGGTWAPFFAGAGTNPGNDSPVRSIAVDPTDPLNQTIYIQTDNAGQYGMYGVMPSETHIVNNTTATFYTKIYATTTAIDQSFGLSTVDVPTGFGSFNCQVAFVRGNLLVRNAGSSTTVGTFAANTWYHIWIVVDNTANTYSVYVNATGDEATVADRVANNFAFRTGTADGDIDRFMTVVNYGANITAGTQVHFDNMAVSSGVNLTAFVPIPEPATMLMLGLGALGLIRRKH